MEESGKVDVNIKVVQTENIQIFVRRLPVSLVKAADKPVGARGKGVMCAGAAPWSWL